MLAKELHNKAVSFSKTYLQSEKELLSVLVKMQENRYFLVLGYTGVFNYCLKALDFSESQACYFSSIVRKSRQVPQLKEAIDAGVLTVSKARRIVPVITQQTSQDWIAKAAVLPQKELEKQVAAANPRLVQERIKPVAANRFELKIGIGDGLHKKWQRAMDLVSKKQRKNASMEETLQCLVECFLNREDPLPKATRASTSVPNTQAKAIPAAIKHQVNQRDQGQCQVPQCPNTRFIDLHHVQPISKGGKHQIENIITLCASHHKMMHLSGHGLSEQAIKPSKAGPLPTEI